VVYLKLAKTGPILLARELYLSRRTQHRQNADFRVRQSLASRAAIEAFVKKTGAQLWIEHDLAHFSQLKKAPTTGSLR
jgi:hypothetical protein